MVSICHYFLILNFKTTDSYKLVDRLIDSEKESLQQKLRFSSHGATGLVGCHNTQSVSGKPVMFIMLFVALATLAGWSGSL